MISLGADNIDDDAVRSSSGLEEVGRKLEKGFEVEVSGNAAIVEGPAWTTLLEGVTWVCLDVVAVLESVDVVDDRGTALGSCPSTSALKVKNQG